VGAVFSAKLADGRMRTYMKGIFDSTWDLTVSLQHDTNAVAWDAEFVLDTTAHLLGSFGALLRRRAEGVPRRCPRCDSYRVTDAFETFDSQSGAFTHTSTCGACDWRGEPTFTSRTAKEEEVAAYQQRKADAEANHAVEPPEENL
jgi:hypothetical protein